jgi:ribose 5-phosphate isomerase A
MTNDVFALESIAAEALKQVPDGSVIGLGSGHAAEAFIRALGARVSQGFRVRGVPTSQASAHLARLVGVPLTTLDESPTLSLAVDGADEVDPAGQMIKGYGGALVREKIVAQAADKFLILVGSEKFVNQLGAHGKLPVEVVPFARGPCSRALEAAGFPSEVRTVNNCEPFVTDNGNLILDCHISLLLDPFETERQILAAPGVVDTGLFLNMRPTVITLRNGGAESLVYGPGPVVGA